LTPSRYLDLAMSHLTPASPSRDEEAGGGPGSLSPETVALRREATLDWARSLGLIGADKDTSITGRVRQSLIEAAKANAGVSSDSELVEYALARLALEDDFGAKLVALKGSLPPDFDLGF
jgi:hypothetical protein